MRVLIYIEPHPIRGSHTMFNDVARRFLPTLKGATADFDVRMYVTGALVSAVGDEAMAPVDGRLIRATESEEGLFADNLVAWEPEGIPAWLNLMSGGDVADGYVEVLRRVWSIFPFDVIVHWGENGAVSRFVRERPVTRIAMELGCTRPPFVSTVVADPFGTNGSALVPRLTVEDLRGIVRDTPMSAAEAMYGYSNTLEALPYEQQFSPLPPGEATTRMLNTRDKIAFLPLQLHDDANLLRFSKYDTVSQVVLDAVPQLADAGYLTVIKTHPGAKTRHQSRAAFALARAALRPWADKVLWLDAVESPYTNSQLIALADLVVTVNSSVGFEALYFDKVVAVLGDAVYKPIGLFPELDQVTTGTFDKDRYFDGIGILRRFMLGGYMSKDSERSDRAAFESIVIAIDSARREHRDDPAPIARALYDALHLSREHRARSRMVKGTSVPGTGEFGVPSPAKASAGSAESAPDTLEQLIAQSLPLVQGHLKATDHESFQNALTECLSDPRKAETIVRAAGIVDQNFYLSKYRDVEKAGKDPVFHWVRYGIGEGRSPREGIRVSSLDQLGTDIAAASVALFDEPTSEAPGDSQRLQERQQKSVTTIADALSSRANRVAVVAHLFYDDLVDEILNRLANIGEEFDLIVTIPDWGNRKIVQCVRAAYPHALFHLSTGNEDHIAPFVEVLPTLVKKGYDAVLHVHTRADFLDGGQVNRELERVWRRESLDALLGNEDRVDRIISTLRTDSRALLVGAEPHFRTPLERRGVGTHQLRERSALGGGRLPFYVEGGMFWFRPTVVNRSSTPEVAVATEVAAIGEDDQALIERVIPTITSAVALTAVWAAPVNPMEPLGAGVRISSESPESRLRSVLVADRNVTSMTYKAALTW